MHHQNAEQYGDIL